MSTVPELLSAGGHFSNPEKTPLSTVAVEPYHHQRQLHRGREFVVGGL